MAIDVEIVKLTSEGWIPFLIVEIIFIFYFWKNCVKYLFLNSNFGKKKFENNFNFRKKKDVEIINLLFKKKNNEKKSFNFPHQILHSATKRENSGGKNDLGAH